MKMSVHCFAGLQSRLGTELVMLDLPPGTRAGELFGYLFADPAEAARWRACARVAINQSYVGSDAVLSEGDYAAIIPPVAGG